MIKPFIIPMFVLMMTISASGEEILQTNPISLSLASCDATLTNEWSTTGNPAGLAVIKGTSLAMMHERRFNLKELSTIGGSAIIPTRYGVVSSSLFQFGFSDFNTTRFAMAYSRQFGKSVMAAVQMNIWSNYIYEAGRFSTLVSDIGLIYSINKNTKIGVHLFNPEQASIQYPDYNIKIPTYLSVGLGWEMMSNAIFYAEFDKKFDSDPSFSTAVEAKLSKMLAARLGYAINKNSVALGFTLELNAIKINMGFAFQQPLGNIYSISTAWQSPPKSKNH